MSKFNAFIEEMKKEKDGFAEIWESNRPKREFINHIAKIRVEKEMTQKELAEKSGLHQSAVARFESGESNPSLKTVLKIIQVLEQQLITRSMTFRMETILFEVPSRYDDTPNFTWEGHCKPEVLLINGNEATG